MKLTLVNTDNAAEKLMAALEGAPVCGFDTESAGPLLRNRKWKGTKTFINVHRSTMIGYSVALPPAPPPKSWLLKNGELRKGKKLEHRGFYIPLFHNKRNLPFGLSRDILHLIAECPRVWAHNVKHDHKTLLIDGSVTIPNMVDSYLAATIMKGGTDGTGLKELAFDLLGRESPEFNHALYSQTGEDALEYCASDAVNTLEVGELLLAQLEADGMGPYLIETDSPFAQCLAEMEKVGMGIDVGKLQSLSRQSLRQMQKASDDWDVLFPDIEIGSDTQIQALFEEGTWTGGQKTPGGAFKVDRDAVEFQLRNCKKGSAGWWAATHRMDYQSASKIATTYTTGLIEEAAQFPDGRLHGDFRQTGTKTGRLSSANPNLQNVPVRSPIGKRVKEAFVPTPGFVFVDLDYSQVELRVLAHFAGGKLADAYANDEDVHQQTADACAKIAPCDRDKGKTINFALQYGASSFRLAKILGCDQETAKRVRVALLNVYPELDALKRKLIRLADARHPRPYTKTIVGRRVYVDDLLSGYDKTRKAGERKVVNSTIQGSAFDIMKIAMVRIRKHFTKAGLWGTDVYFVNNLHDAVTMEVRDDEELIQRVSSECSRIMQGAYKLRVPLVAEPKVGRNNWLETK